jgi:hypothetical protein
VIVRGAVTLLEAAALEVLLSEGSMRVLRSPSKGTACLTGSCYRYISFIKVRYFNSSSNQTSQANDTYSKFFFLPDKIHIHLRFPISRLKLGWADRILDALVKRIRRNKETNMQCHKLNKKR